jgi:hypothetical protein
VKHADEYEELVRREDQFLKDIHTGEQIIWAILDVVYKQGDYINVSTVEDILTHIVNLDHSLKEELVKVIISKSVQANQMKMDSGDFKPLDSGNEWADDLWSHVLFKIQTKISQTAFKTWFKPTQAMVQKDELIILCPNEFVRTWIEKHYKKLISGTIEELKRKNIEIRFVVREND